MKLLTEIFTKYDILDDIFVGVCLTCLLSIFWLLHRKCGHWRKIISYKNYLCYIFAYFAYAYVIHFVIYCTSGSLVVKTAWPDNIYWLKTLAAAYKWHFLKQT